MNEDIQEIKLLLKELITAMNTTVKIEHCVGGVLSKPVTVLNAKNLRVIAKCPSISHAAAKGDTNSTYVKECCELKRVEVKGLTYRYTEDYEYV